MYQASIASNGNRTYHAATANLTFDMGADGKCASPVHVLLASLCGCIGHYVELFLSQSSCSFESFEVSASCTPPTDSHDLGFIDLVIRVRGEELSALAQAELCSFVTQCRVYGSLGAGSRVRISVAR